METPIEQPNENLRVLVVEDDVVGRMLLNEILKESNMKVVFARNGQEAVDKVTADPSFDFILMDIKMSTMNGFEATIRIRELGFTNPIIAQTAYESEEDRIKISSSGFSACIIKPIKQHNLMKVLSEVSGTNFQNC
jgi:CheY-like chemotaxis protein